MIQGGDVFEDKARFCVPRDLAKFVKYVRQSRTSENLDVLADALLERDLIEGKDPISETNAWLDRTDLTLTMQRIAVDYSALELRTLASITIPAIAPTHYPIPRRRFLNTPLAARVHLKPWEKHR